MKKIIILLFAVFLFADDLNSSFEILPENFDKSLKEIQQDLNLSENVNVSKYRDFKYLNLFAFKKNYFMPFVYDGIHHSDRKRVEAEFQLSVMVPIFRMLKADFFFGYTMHAVWQVYDKKHSSPFRDTNHEPQFFMLWQPKHHNKYKNLVLDKIYLGLIHQSNGRDVPYSRSWNRVEVGFDFRDIKFDHFFYSVHLWKRFNENKPKSTITNPNGDDNPDLTDYIGTGYVQIAYKNADYLIEVTHQNNIFDYNINRGNTKIEAILPSINKHFKWYLKYFYGYGNTLIDYNVLTSRFGIGIYVGGLEF